MNFTALLCFQVLLVLMETACSSPLPQCKNIKSNIFHHMHDFKHVSNLGNSSVAPWTMIYDTVADREPERILHAKCEVCTVPGMIAKPITFQVHVSSYDKDTQTWKRCPYEVAVGCTCVRE